MLDRMVATWWRRLVLIVAVLASVATSRRGWSVVASIPPGAPTVAPAGTRGLSIVLEASQEPSVSCMWPGVGDVSLVPLLTGRQYVYLCPPGGTLGPITIGGHADGGCGVPPVPSDAFLRVVRLELVETWSLAAEANLSAHATEYDPTEGQVSLVVHTTGRPFLEYTPGPGLGRGFVSGRGSNDYDIDVPFTDPDHFNRSVHVRATVYGVCAAGAPCAAPTGQTIEVTAR